MGVPHGGPVTEAVHRSGRELSCVNPQCVPPLAAQVVYEWSVQAALDLSTAVRKKQAQACPPPLSAASLPSRCTALWLS